MTTIGINVVKPIQALTRAGKRFIVFQVWDFEVEQYDLTMFVVEEDLSTGEVATQAMRSRCYAIGVNKLLTLMADAGFQDLRRLDDVFYQPVLVGTRPR